MLRLAHKLQARELSAVTLVRSDATAIPSRQLRGCRAIGFGIRNVADPVCALRIARARRAAGWRSEFGQPRIPNLRNLCGYFRYVMPAIDALSPGTSAYSYLPASVRAFPPPPEFADIIAATGSGRTVLCRSASSTSSWRSMTEHL
jgi:ubiquinone/menaquinone biosynthesis C-methylase UbiE